MRISRPLLGEIVAHALQDAPNECCGMVAARGGEAVAVHPVPNEAASPFRFVMAPMDQYRATMAIEDAGLEIGAIYHSHTRSAPEPSQTDVNHATQNWPDPVWIIVGVADPDAPEVRAWRIRDGRVDEVSLEVV